MTAPTVEPDVTFPRLLGAPRDVAMLLLPHADKPRLVVSFRECLNVGAAALSEVVSIGTQYGGRACYVLDASAEVRSVMEDVAERAGWGGLSFEAPPVEEFVRLVCGAVDPNAPGGATCNREPHADKWHLEMRDGKVWANWSGQPSAAGFASDPWTNDTWRLIADALRGAASHADGSRAGYRYVNGVDRVPSERLRSIAAEIDEGVAEAQARWDSEHGPSRD